LKSRSSHGHACPRSLGSAQNPHSWQWYRNGVAIPAATKAKYKLTSADKKSKLKVTAVCTSVGYQGSATSKSTGKVK
jgi:hypothetical protein